MLHLVLALSQYSNIEDNKNNKPQTMPSDPNKHKTVSSFRSIDYRDSKYHGCVLMDPNQNPMKEGPGILYLDCNHCIVSKWNNNDMDGIDSIVLTSSSSFLDISGEDLPLQMGIKVINPLEGYIVLGNIERNQWIIEDRASENPVYLKLRNSQAGEMIVEEFEELSEQKQRHMQYYRKDQYKCVIEKIKRILQQPKSSQNNKAGQKNKKPEFKIVQSQYSPRYTKQNRLTCSISSTYPEYLQLEITSIQSQQSSSLGIKQSFSLPSINSIAYWNSYKHRQLYYTVAKINTSFSDQQISECEDCIGDSSFKYILNSQMLKKPEPSQHEQINAIKQYVGKTKQERSSKSPPVSRQRHIFNKSASKIKQRSMADNARQLKRQYHMISVDFVNSSHQGFTQAIESVMSVLDKVYSVFKKQSIERWSGHPQSKFTVSNSKFDKSNSQLKLQNNYEERIQPHSNNVVGNNKKNRYQFEATEQDLKEQLMKIQTGEYSQKKRAKYQNTQTSKLNKTFDQSNNYLKQGQSYRNSPAKILPNTKTKINKYENLRDNMPYVASNYRVSPQKTSAASGMIYSQHHDIRTEEKISLELAELNKANQQHKKIAQEKRNPSRMGKKLVTSSYSPLNKSSYDHTISKQYYGMENEQTSRVKRTNETDLIRLTNSYLTISQQLKNQSSRAGIPLRTQKKKEKIWERDYGAALTRYHKIS